jgi:hypothetical protein
MRINRALCPFPLSADLIAILERAVTDGQVGEQRGAIINFRDPRYSYEHGGFHPVEICISAEGRLDYITDFAFVGRPPFIELAKEIDFDFKLGLFQHMSLEYPLKEGAELFAIWEENFVGFFHMGVYTVKVEEI